MFERKDFSLLSRSQQAVLLPEFLGQHVPPRPPRLPPSAVTAGLSWPQYLLQIQASSLSSSEASSSSSASGSDTESWCASNAHLDAIMLRLYCVCPGVCDLTLMRCCVDPATATSRMQTDCCISFTASIEQLSLGDRPAWHLVHLACIGDHGQCVGHPGAAWRQRRQRQRRRRRCRPAQRAASSARRARASISGQRAARRRKAPGPRGPDGAVA